MRLYISHSMVPAVTYNLQISYLSVVLLVVYGLQAKPIPDDSGKCGTCLVEFLKFRQT